MKQIYLVHDQDESPWVRRHFLERAGYEVLTIASSEGLLERLRDAPPDLLVIDVLVEGLNGFELCRSVRERFTPDELPIVLGSAVYTALVFREEAERAGAQEYLTAPRDLDTLLAAVNGLLEARPSQRAPSAA